MLDGAMTTTLGLALQYYDDHIATGTPQTFFINQVRFAILCFALPPTFTWLAGSSGRIAGQCLPSVGGGLRYRVAAERLCHRDRPRSSDRLWRSFHLVPVDHGPRYGFIHTTSGLPRYGVLSLI